MDINELVAPIGLTYDDISIVPDISDVYSRADIDVSTRLKDVRLAIPIIASPMKHVCEREMADKLASIGGLGIIHRFMSIDQQVSHTNFAGSDYFVGAAVGVNGDYLQRTKALDENGLYIFCIDVAHGATKLHIEAAQKIRDIIGRDPVLIASNVATLKQLRFLEATNLFDAVRVNIGNGSVCSTRIQTGIGVPSATAIHQCSQGNLAVIADGGISKPADLCKAIALGASAVMVGRIFAGCQQTPGQPVYDNMTGNYMKEYAGSASYEVQRSRGIGHPRVEGVSKPVPAKGSIKNVIDAYMDGLCSACSYVGAHDLFEFQQKARFVRVTNSGQQEALPHLRT